MNVSKFHKKLEDNGFVIIKNFFPKELCREIKNFSKKLKPKGFIFVKQDQALPLTVLALYPTIVTNDG